MKKIIALILSAIMIFSLTVPAFAAPELNFNPRAKNPVVYISGDSNELAYDNETKLFAIEDMFKIYKNSEGGSISEASFNILYPFILKGIAFNDWDDYYDAVYKEISDVYKPIMLDENGNPNTDCDIPSWQKQDKINAMSTNRAAADGTYGERDYRFYYDWRLDPIGLADELHEYIEGVKAVTGKKVSISVKCLGCNVVLAYIAKYGTDSLKGVSIDVSTSMGADFVSGMISGKFGVDGNSISRLITDLSERENFKTDLMRFVTSTIDLLSNTGVLDTLTDVARKQLYSKIEYGIISALARASFFTFPGYWGMVTVDDFDDAVRYVFGEEGDEKRETYKGLIEKVTVFNDQIKKNVLPILKTLETNGVNVCVISKYGIQMVPSLGKGDLVGDEYVSAAHSSLGETTSTVYDTLSDEYIAAQTEKGLGKYISPDKQIDASTCLFPDYTWFFKGVKHGNYTAPEVAILMEVIDADEQLTVDDFYLTQFIVYDYETRTAEAMTEENCHNEYWTADKEIDQPTTKEGKLRSFLISLMRWVKSLFKLLTSRIKKDAKTA